MRNQKILNALAVYNTAAGVLFAYRAFDAMRDNEKKGSAVFPEGYKEI